MSVEKKIRLSRCIKGLPFHQLVSFLSDNVLSARHSRAHLHTIAQCDITGGGVGTGRQRIPTSAAVVEDATRKAWISNHVVTHAYTHAYKSTHRQTYDSPRPATDRLAARWFRAPGFTGSIASLPLTSVHLRARRPAGRNIAPPALSLYAALARPRGTLH